MARVLKKKKRLSIVYSTQAHKSEYEDLMTEDGILTLHISVIEL